MRYRIIKETQAGGEGWYYIQQSNFPFIWRYERAIKDLSCCPYRVGYQAEWKAQEHIENLKEADLQKKLRRVIKRRKL